MAQKNWPNYPKVTHNGFKVAHYFGPGFPGVSFRSPDLGTRQAGPKLSQEDHLGSALPRCGELEGPPDPRVFLWALVMGPFDSGGVSSMGAYSEYGI